MIWLIISIWVEIGFLIAVLFALAALVRSTDQHANRIRGILSQIMLGQSRSTGCVFIGEEEKSSHE